MIYKFRTRRTRKPRFDAMERNEKAEEPIGLIQGRMPDSRQEWMTAKALERMKLNYIYQFPVNGGRARGGYLIDFVVLTTPLATMIEIGGNHWHTGEMGADDKKRQADIEDLMRDMCKIPILTLFVPDMINDNAVEQRLRRELI